MMNLPDFRLCSVTLLCPQKMSPKSVYSFHFIPRKNPENVLEQCIQKSFFSFCPQGKPGTRATMTKRRRDPEEEQKDAPARRRQAPAAADQHADRQAPADQHADWQAPASLKDVAYVLFNHGPKEKGSNIINTQRSSNTNTLTLHDIRRTSTQGTFVVFDATGPVVVETVLIMQPGPTTPSQFRRQGHQPRMIQSLVFFQCAWNPDKRRWKRMRQAQRPDVLFSDNFCPAVRIKKRQTHKYKDKKYDQFS